MEGVDTLAAGAGTAAGSIIATGDPCGWTTKVVMRSSSLSHKLSVNLCDKEELRMTTLVVQPHGSPVAIIEPAAVPAPAARVSTPSIVATMLRVSKQVSDLIFSPGRAPQVEVSGELKEVN